MFRKTAVTVLALCLLSSGLVHPEQDESNIPINQTQHVFSDQVIATPVACPSEKTASASTTTGQPTCSLVTGGVTEKFCVPGATVSEIIVCQDSTSGPGAVISTDVQQVNPETCSFSGIVPNRCKGNNCSAKPTAPLFSS